MKLFLAGLLLVTSLYAHAQRCEISGQYRCGNGREGVVHGKGRTIDEAKINARDRARDLCGQIVDYVRFMDGTANC